MLLDPRTTWSLANRIDAVLGALPPGIAAHASARPMHASSSSEPLRTQRSLLLGQSLRSSAGPSTECCATRSDCAPQAPERIRRPLHLGVALSEGLRYRHIGATMGALAHREPTMAQHVHVAVPDAASAVRALDGLRSDLPLLLALSANSPFWRGADSGFASIRTPIFSMFPRVGIPRRFGSYGKYVSVIDAMLSAGVIHEPGFLWWDVRLRPRLGTIEIRIMDAQSRLTDAAALTALVQCLVHRCAHGMRTHELGPEALAENRFLAARDGVDAQLIDDHGRGPGGRRWTRLQSCSRIAAPSRRGWAARPTRREPKRSRTIREPHDNAVSSDVSD